MTVADWPVHTVTTARDDDQFGTNNTKEVTSDPSTAATDDEQTNIINTSPTPYVTTCCTQTNPGIINVNLYAQKQ